MSNLTAWHKVRWFVMLYVAGVLVVAAVAALFRLLVPR